MNKETNVASLVLIVDDEYIGRETLQSVLEGEGYELEMAEKGFQAIEKAKKLFLLILTRRQIPQRYFCLTIQPYL